MPRLRIWPRDYDAVARSEAKSERLNARITPSAKALLERASSLEGRSVTDFVIEKAMEAAVRSIADYDRIVLTEQERSRFFAALLAPPKPSEHARRAGKRYTASRVVSSVGVVLDAYSADAKAFWRNMEFVSMGERKAGMERFFLPMACIELLW